MDSSVSYYRLVHSLLKEIFERKMANSKNPATEQQSNKVFTIDKPCYCGSLVMFNFSFVNCTCLLYTAKFKHNFLIYNYEEI